MSEVILRAVLVPPTFVTGSHKYLKKFYGYYSGHYSLDISVMKLFLDGLREKIRDNESCC